MAGNSHEPNKGLPIGTVIAGRYEIAAQLGKASYKVTDANGGKVCVLKFPLLETSEAANAIPDKTLLSFQNENAIGLIDTQCDPSTGLFYVREFIDGKTLAQVMAEKPSLNQIEFLDTFEQACMALSYFKKKGLPHANLKSSNVIIAENSLVCVVDPLAADVPRAALPSEPSADIFQLGCLMYESLSSKRVTPDGPEPVPFASLVPARNVDEQIEKVIFRCLNKDTKQRYQSADALRSDLKRIEEGGEIKDIPSGASAAGNKNVLLIISTVVLLVVALAAATYFMSKKTDTKKNESSSSFSEAQLKSEEEKADGAFRSKDYATAAQVLNMIEPTYSNTFGNESRAHARLLHKLARAQMLNKEVDQARDTYVLLAEMIRSKPDLAPRQLLSQLSAEVFGIGSDWFKQGDFKNAEDAFSAAQTVEKAAHGDKSPIFYYILIYTAICEAKNDDFEKAKKDFERAIEKFETKFNDPKNSKFALCSYAQALSERVAKAGDEREAKKFRKRSRAVLEDALVLAQDRLSPRDVEEVKAQLAKLDEKQ